MRVDYYSEGQSDSFIFGDPLLQVPGVGVWCVDERRRTQKTKEGPDSVGEVRHTGLEVFL